MLKSRFIDLAEFLEVKDAEFHWRVLENFYSERWRAYHTLEHIEEMLGLMDKHRLHDFIAFHRTAEWAVFWHDAYQNTKLGDRECVNMSAAMSLAAVPHRQDRWKSRMQEMIYATAHDEEPYAWECKAVADLDLAILGQSETHYDWYAKQIRQEYSWVPEEVFRVKRLSLLTDLLQRGQIYYLKSMQDDYELPARKNLAREIKALSEAQLASPVVL